MTIRKTNFIRRLPTFGLSLEIGTERVPNDGKYYLILNDAVIGTFKSKNVAMKAFDAKRGELGFQPETSDDITPDEQLRQERMWTEYYRSEEYWGDAGSYRRGGKLSNR